jgi:hypothetical protein
MSKEKNICDVADEIGQLLMERLDGPKDAAKALLIAHVVLTRNEGLSREAVSSMLIEYRTLFRLSYFGDEQ